MITRNLLSNQEKRKKNEKASKKENTIMSITYEQLLDECNNEVNFIVSPDCKNERKGYFTNARIDRTTLPAGWYAYDIRHGDNGNFCTIENYVKVNHAGTFVTNLPIAMNKHGYFSLRTRHNYTFI